MTMHAAANAICGEVATACMRWAGLKDGVTFEMALDGRESDREAAGESNIRTSNRDQGGGVKSAERSDRGRYPADFAGAAGGAALLLMIATMNVASLLLVRSESAAGGRLRCGGRWAHRRRD